MYNDFVATMTAHGWVLDAALQTSTENNLERWKNLRTYAAGWLAGGLFHVTRDGSVLKKGTAYTLEELRTLYAEADQVGYADGHGETLYNIGLIKGYDDNKPKAVALTEEEVVKLTTTFKPVWVEPKRKPSIVPAKFYTDGVRRSVCTIENCLLILDIDDGAILALAERWKRVGLAFVIYSSFNHMKRAHVQKNPAPGTKDISSPRPRGRAVFFLSEPVPAGQWPLFYDSARRLLADDHADACKGAPHLFALPTALHVDIDANTFAYHHDGKPLDVRSVPVDPVRKKQCNAPHSPRSSRSRTPDYRGSCRDSLHRRYNLRANVRVLLETAGWFYVDRSARGELWLRPGDTDKRCSGELFLYDDDGIPRFKPYTNSAWPLEQHETYTPFNLRRALEFGGDGRRCLTKILEEEQIND